MCKHVRYRRELPWWVFAEWVLSTPRAREGLSGSDFAARLAKVGFWSLVTHFAPLIIPTVGRSQAKTERSR